MKEYGTRRLYEELYCARGDRENVIKQQHLQLGADRTSTTTMRANQWRRYFSAFTSVLFQVIKHYGLKNTTMAKAQCDTIRHRWLKIAGKVRVSARKAWLSLTSCHPWQHLFLRASANLQAVLALKAAAG